MCDVRMMNTNANEKKKKKKTSSGLAGPLFRARYNCFGLYLNQRLIVEFRNRDPELAQLIEQYQIHYKHIVLLISRSFFAKFSAISAIICTNVM